MQKILRSDSEGIRAYCENARMNMPNIFSTRKRARGFSLHLDGEGKRVDLKKTPEAKPAKSIFCVKKEESCRRCGYEYADVKGVPKETECPGCKLKFALGKHAAGALPGISFKRESATRMVPKNYMDQARTLIGVFPVTLGDWFSQPGITELANILRELDEKEEKFIEASKPARKLIKLDRTSKKDIFAGFNAMVLSSKKKAG